ncbi:dephospho-CoA kinase [Yoonia sp. 2307UL14-13]|uniref:dephospho-CoA kinase n=1 Tax=Yoonia sp. 2307UL14-13 TaxID=3126506 RepID=UPI003098F7C5
MSFFLGLTGSIGMGKSTTAQMFRDEGIPVWDADAAVHQLYRAGGDAVEPIQNLFPAVIQDGQVSRAAVKGIIAEDSEALNKIESVVHPLVAEHRQNFIDSHDDQLLVFDIPLLFETDANHWLDAILVVTAPPDVQRDRVMQRPGMTKAQFNALLERQVPDVEKRARADYIIETLTLDDTHAAVRKLISELKGVSDA